MVSGKAPKSPGADVAGENYQSIGRRRRRTGLPEYDCDTEIRRRARVKITVIGVIEDRLRACGACTSRSRTLLEYRQISPSSCTARREGEAISSYDRIVDTLVLVSGSTAIRRRGTGLRTELHVRITFANTDLAGAAIIGTPSVRQIAR
jgi:hypothetical protein